jgi:hypothetical protein
VIQSEERQRDRFGAQNAAAIAQLEAEMNQRCEWMNVQVYSVSRTFGFLQFQASAGGTTSALASYAAAHSFVLIDELNEQRKVTPEIKEGCHVKADEQKRIGKHAWVE